MTSPTPELPSTSLSLCLPHFRPIFLRVIGSVGYTSKAFDGRLKFGKGPECTSSFLKGPSFFWSQQFLIPWRKNIFWIVGDANEWDAVLIKSWGFPLDGTVWLFEWGGPRIWEVDRFILGKGRIWPSLLRSSRMMVFTPLRNSQFQMSGLEVMYWSQ